MSKNARSIHTGVKLNEPIVIDSNDIVEFDDIQDEEIIAVPYDDYTTTQDLIKVYEQEKAAFTNAMTDLHTSGEDVSAFMDNPWFPSTIRDEINDAWVPSDEDWQSDFWNPWDSHEVYDED